MFHRDGAKAFQAGLKNIENICSVLGNPQNNYKTIHIAGTNGKGSVSHMLASILQHSGYKTGLYTSPHLVDFRERIKVNGQLVPEKFVVSFIDDCKSLITTFKPSFFELTTAMAFDFFSKNNIDIAVIETGLGGRLDSTNIITPEVSIITNVTYDHTDILGETLEKIAVEKAGIIKSGIPIIIGETHPITKKIFIDIAKNRGAEIKFADQDFVTKSISGNIHYQSIEVKSANCKKIYILDLLGHYQNNNLSTTLSCLELLKNKGFNISDKTINNGLKTVIETTGLLGRWQILNEKPLIVADTGHNEAGIKYTMQQLKNLPHERLHIVFGLVKDKDVNKILDLLPKEALYYFTKANIPRALDEKELEQMAIKKGLNGKSYNNVNNAIENAKTLANVDDVIYIGGSTFIVGEAIS
jgi:dihydrofolate synthase/folylpolyglutamate synthase